jgi:hypothetical protein
MSFQETLVSKKQKKTKKILKMYKKPKLQKKQRLLPSASLIAITTTKRDLKLSQEYFKVKNCKIPQFSFFLIAIQFKCYLITEMIS